MTVLYKQLIQTGSVLPLLPVYTVLGFPLYEDTGDGMAARHQLYSSAIDVWYALLMKTPTVSDWAVHSCWFKESMAMNNIMINFASFLCSFEKHSMTVQTQPEAGTIFAVIPVLPVLQSSHTQRLVNCTLLT